MRDPRADRSQHESIDADAQHDVTVARRPDSAEGSRGALVQGASNVDMATVQAGILSRLAQVEKTVQGHGGMIATWQSEEEHENVPHAGVPQEAPHNVQQAAATEQQGGTAEDAPQRSAIVEGPSQMQQAVQAAAEYSGEFIGKLNYMGKMQLFQGNKPEPGQGQRSWKEWQAKFTHNARLCHMEADMYYDMAIALLSDHMREVWLTYLEVKPEDSTWEGLNSYMGVNYAALDKTVDAEQKFEETKLQVGTEKAWQTYANAQAGHIADMGAAAERTMTDRGIWSHFLKNISTVPDVHASAFQAYMGSKAEYDALPVQARITKLSPVVQTYLKSSAMGQDRSPAVEAEAGMAAGKWKGSKRYLESGSAVQTTDQKHDSMAEGRKQPESSIEYHAVPKDVDFQKCPDVGFQNNDESRPYSHSLRMHLQTEGRCLVCWGTSHGIADCPHRSEKLKEAMEVKRQNRGSRRGNRAFRGWRGK